jgi:hypothetical protein
VTVATYSLDIPDFTPTLTNSIRGRHWRAEHRAKSKDAEFYRLYAAMQGVPAAAGKRRVALFCVGWPAGRMPDADGFDKCLLDSLVRAGLLTDDGPAGLEGRVAVTLARGASRRTVLVLEDVA